MLKLKTQCFWLYLAKAQRKKYYFYTITLYRGRNF